MLLASCGGGGGGGGSTTAAQTNTPQVPTPPSNAYKAIAQARPRPGSVTQSSNFNSSNITTDTITLSTFRISEDEGGFIVTNAGKSNYRIVNDFGPNYPPQAITRKYASKLEDSLTFTGAGVKPKSCSVAAWCAIGLDFYDKYDRSFSYREQDNESFIFMRKGHTDSDYLGWGLWGSNKNGTYFTPYDDLGIFVDGSDPFNQNNMASLTGTATYSGPVLAYSINSNSKCPLPCHGSQDSTRNHQLTYHDGLADNELYGSITLTARFGNSDSLGTLEGSMNLNGVFYSNQWDNDGILEANEADSRAIPGTIILERANISNTHSGFAEGNVSGSLNGRSYTGKWGSQFYGNNSADGNPENVGGTMAAESGDYVIFAGWTADINRIINALNQGPGYLAPGQSQGSPLDPQELANSYISPGGAVGDAFAQSIGQQQVTGFGTVPGVSFTLNGDSFVGATPGANLAASLNSFMAPADWAIPEQWRFSLKPFHVISTHGASLEQGSRLFHLASPQGWAASFHTQGVEVAYQPATVPFSFTAGAVHEVDSLLGTQAKGIFGSLAADTFHVGSRWQTKLGQWSLAASGEVGLVAPTVAGSSVIDGIDTLTTNAFALEAAREFNNGNVLRFSLSQPLRVAHGSMAYTLANGSQDGLVTGESYSASLAPTGRQLDFTTALTVPAGEGDLSLGLTMSTDSGHRAGADTVWSLFGGYQAQW